MDRVEVENLENDIKVYDSEYEPKRIEFGSVIDIIMEMPDSDKPLSSQVMYVKKENDVNGPANMGSISYETAKKYFLGCYKDETIDVGNAKITINEIYANIDEYVNRDEKDIEIGIGSIVDATHNGHKKLYYIVEPTDDIKVQKDFDVIDTNSPLAINLLSKKMGDRINYDIHLIQNEVIVNRVYKGINDYNKRKSIHLVKDGSVVEVLIDKVPFVLNCVNNTMDKVENDLYEYVDIETPLGKEILNKTEGDSFNFDVRGKQLKGYINKVYDNMDEYLEETLKTNKKVK